MPHRRSSSDPLASIYRPRHVDRLHSPIVPAYQLSEPAIAAFVVIPLLLFAILVWGIATVWRRAGASAAAARRAAVITALITGTWMALTWIAAESGVLRAWDRRPPPFALLIAGIVTVSLVLA